MGKNVAGFCPDCARIAQNVSRMAARPGRRARIQERRSRGLSSVKETACSTRAKYSSSSFSACARVAIGAPQFTDAIASSTAMKARAILAAYWVKAIGVARLMSSAIDSLMIGLERLLACAPCAVRMLRSPFWTGATHVVQLRPVGVEQGVREGVEQPRSAAMEESVDL